MATPCRSESRKTLVSRCRSLCPCATECLSESAGLCSSDDRAHAVAANRARDGAGTVNVEDDQRQMVFLAERDRRLIHDAQLGQHHISVDDIVVLHGGLIFFWICCIDAF